MSSSKLLPTFKYESVYEIDYDGDVGSRIGVLIEGHLSDFEIECFLARELAEIYDDEEYAPTKGFDLDHIWWSTQPYYDDEGNMTDSHIYVYSDTEKEGWTAATRLQENMTWSHWCANHPDEEAHSGVPLDQVAEIDHHKSEDGKHIYLCRECSTRFYERLAAERKRIMALPENQSVRCPKCNMLTVLRLHTC